MHPISIPLICIASAVAADEEEEVDAWSGSAGIAFAWLTGNSDVLELTGVGLLEYNGDDFIVTLEVDGVYERDAAEGGEEREVSAAAVDSWGRVEYRLTKVWEIFAMLGGETDHLASLEARVDAELGVGLTAIEHAADEKEILARFYLGWHFARDFRRQYYPEPVDLPDVDLWGPGVHATLRAEITETVGIREDAEVLIDVIGDTRVLVDSVSALTFWITQRLALAVYFLLDFDTKPPPDTVKTDTSLTVGFELNL